MKYQFSICRSIASLVIILLLLYVISAGASTYLFFNLPAFVITFGLCFFMIMLVYEMEFLKFIPHALRILFCRPLEANPQFARIALFGSRSIIGAGLIGMLIMLIQMLSNIGDPPGIGVGMATSFVCPFYAIISSEIFFAIVYQSFKIEPSKKEDSSALPMIHAGLPFLLILFSISIFLVIVLNFYIWN